jgi:hypothetical protein
VAGVLQLLEGASLEPAGADGVVGITDAAACGVVDGVVSHVEHSVVFLEDMVAKEVDIGAAGVLDQSPGGGVVVEGIGAVGHLADESAAEAVLLEHVGKGASRRGETVLGQGLEENALLLAVVKGVGIEAEEVHEVTDLTAGDGGAAAIEESLEGVDDLEDERVLVAERAGRLTVSHLDLSSE